MSSSRLNPSGNWKAIQHDHDQLMLNADTQQYFALSKRHQWLLLSLCEYATWKTRWYSTSGSTIDYDELDRLVSDMIYRLMTPLESEIEMFQLRQNPDNLCLLEQSHDGGDTWSPAFDYSLCGLSNEDYESYQQRSEAENQRRLDLYDGTPDSIHDDTPTTYFDDGSGGELALCAALYAYVQRQVHDTQWRYRIAAGLAGAGAGLLAMTGIIGLVVGGLVAFIVGLALADVEAAANDEQAIKNVTCALKDDLLGTPVTLSDFQAGIAALSSAIHNEQTIIAILQGNMGATVNYLMFLEMLGQAQGAALAGVVSCPCSDTWCYLFDFETAGIDDWADNNLGYTMNYVAASGIQHRDCVDTLSSPDIGYRGISIRVDHDARVITSVSITYEVVKGTFDANNPCLQIRVGGSLVINLQNTSETNGQHTRLWEGELSAEDLQVFYRASRDSSAPYSYSGSVVIKSITVTGQGINPFGEDNCE